MYKSSSMPLPAIQSMEQELYNIQNLHKAPH